MKTLMTAALLTFGVLIANTHVLAQTPEQIEWQKHHQELMQQVNQNRERLQQCHPDILAELDNERRLRAISIDQEKTQRHIADLELQLQRAQQKIRQLEGEKADLQRLARNQERDIEQMQRRERNRMYEMPQR